MNNNSPVLLPERSEEFTNRAERAVRSLSITRRYDGYKYLVYASIIVAHDPDALRGITKHIYPVIARECGTSVQSIERSIRTAVQHCWDHCDRALLDQIAGYRVIERPTNSDFIDIIATYIRLHK